jgi:hypothetical protein
MIIRAYIHFFRFRYSQTIGVCRPTLPQLCRLPDELRLPLVFCATASDGQRQPLATTAALTTTARQPWNLWRRWLWWLLQRHRHRCLSWQRRLHLMAPLPRPLDRHRSELADDLTYNFPPHQASPTFVSPLAHSPPAAWTQWMTPGALTYGLPPQQADPTFAPPLAHPPSAAWTPWMTSSALPYGLPPQQVDPTLGRSWRLHHRRCGHRG